MLSCCTCARPCVSSSKSAGRARAMGEADLRALAACLGQPRPCQAQAAARRPPCALLARAHLVPQLEVA